MKKVYKGLVWSGFVGEYKHPPIYIIPPSDEAMEDGIFVSDIFRKFLKKKVRITIEVIK